MVKGEFVRSGGPELARELEKTGYEQDFKTQPATVEV
jgi:Fe-S cluster assembly ATPase SufC